MSDEPGHKAMLYFLEVLMISTGLLTISQLAGRLEAQVSWQKCEQQPVVMSLDFVSFCSSTHLVDFDTTLIC